MIAFVYMIPVGMIQAITNQQLGLNVITELVIGYALPGRPLAMMLFKTWGYITMAQGLQFTSDFKLGHYMKIPQRPMFFCQVVATVLAGTTQLGVQAWMFTVSVILNRRTRANVIARTSKISVILTTQTTSSAHQLKSSEQPRSSGVLSVLNGSSPMAKSTTDYSSSSSSERSLRPFPTSSPAAIQTLSSNTSISPLSIPEPVSFLPRQRSTTFRGVLSDLSSNITSEGGISRGGVNTTTSYLPL